MVPDREDMCPSEESERNGCLEVSLEGFLRPLYEVFTDRGIENFDADEEARRS
jgi:hypothetical protein